jgi:hypothetical protein
MPNQTPKEKLLAKIAGQIRQAERLKRAHAAFVSSTAGEVSATSKTNMAVESRARRQRDARAILCGRVAPLFRSTTTGSSD